MAEQYDVIIVGAGIGGLACTRILQRLGRKVALLESDSSIGGRLKTDSAEGYLFDRGFQVLQLAYPAAQELLDYKQLQLRRFPPGVRIRVGDSFRILADPLRKPTHILQTMRSGVGTFGDRLRLVRLALEAGRGGIEDLFLQGNERYASDFLKDYGFSEEMISRFFLPFMTGVCLDPEIRVTQRFLLFVLRMFVHGDVAIPAGGMGEIPRQLSQAIPAETIRCACRVETIESGGVRLATGERLTARSVVVATTGPEADRLLGRSGVTASCREACLYYSTDLSPVREPFLTLNGTGSGLINSVNFPSMVAPACAPPGKTLISAVVPGYPAWGDELLEGAVREELGQWFGDQVAGWHFLRMYTIPHALPRPEPPTSNPYQIAAHLGDGIFDCSEARTLPAIQWALLGARQTATEVDNYLAERTR